VREILEKVPIALRAALRGMLDFGYTTR